MSGRKIGVALVLFLSGASVAIACGPFFPWQLLDDRVATLKSTPKNSFAFEAAHLVAAAPDRLKTEEATLYASDQDRIDAFNAAESKGLTPAQISTLQAVRQRTDADDDAYKAGEGLPEAVRLYATGAIDFHKPDLANAALRFKAILDLPETSRSARAVWAAYMLGRTAALSGDAAMAATEFQLTRKLVLQGEPDPLGLAVASFGEQAKLHYDRANGELVRGSAVPATPPAVPADTSNPGAPAPVLADPTFVGYTLPDASVPEFRSEMAAAATLYAQQAARGSDSGLQSLRMIAENVLSSPDRIDAVVSDSLLQRLLVDYALARIGDTSTSDEGTHDAGTREPQVKANPQLPGLVDAILKFGGPNPAGADRLAALSYRIGRYDLAAALANKSSGPLAEWVKAKIALQKGDLAGAAAHYAAASRGFPETQNSNVLDPDNANLIVGENGVVALARGEYVDALDKLYPVSKVYWGDVAYISERVLTSDELKSFVDAKVPATANKTTTSPDNYSWNPADPAIQLRNLLGRRLMREGRFDDAFAYFSDPKIRGEAQAYAAALHESTSDWWAVDRAEASFRASVLARQSGLDILGYEAAPDFFDLSGEYDVGIGQDDPKGPYVTPDERARTLASRSIPNIRYHYRYIAVDEASRAADLLPPRSQAFAAALCSAEGWMMSTPGEDARVKSLYLRYIKNGARLAWAKKFGRNCPQPDFAGASALQRTQFYHHWRHYASAHRWWLVALVLMVAVGGVFGAFRLWNADARAKLSERAQAFGARILNLFGRK